MHSVSTSLSMGGLENEYRIKSVMDFIIKNRCRGLPSNEIIPMITDIKEELLLSKSMWDEFDGGIDI